VHDTASAPSGAEEKEGSEVKGKERRRKRKEKKKKATIG